jgi:hypothetical protein
MDGTKGSYKAVIGRSVDQTVCDGKERLKVTNK